MGTKITIALDDEQVEEIRELVAAGQSANISAFVRLAVEVALLEAAEWKELLDDALQQTGGPVTKNERLWADAVLSPRQHKRSGQGGVT